MEFIREFWEGTLKKGGCAEHERDNERAKEVMIKQVGKKIKNDMGTTHGRRIRERDGKCKMCGRNGWVFREGCATNAKRNGKAV